MATVYKGIKSRIAGALYGLLFVATGIAAYVLMDLPLDFSGAGEAVPLLLVALFVLYGLFNVGKAALQSDYRIIVNLHRGSLNVRFGHRLFQ